MQIFFLRILPVRIRFTVRLNTVAVFSALTVTVLKKIHYQVSTTFIFHTYVESDCAAVTHWEISVFELYRLLSHDIE